MSSTCLPRLNALGYRTLHPPPSYPVALELIASGKVDVKPLVTHRYKLEETLAAFQTAKEQADGAVKVIITCSEGEK